MPPSLFYREQAVREQKAADAATLIAVRERCQRAADAWGVLATRSENTQAARAAIAAQKLLDGSNENPDRALASA